MKDRLTLSDLARIQMAVLKETTKYQKRVKFTPEGETKTMNHMLAKNELARWEETLAKVEYMYINHEVIWPQDTDIDITQSSTDSQKKPEKK